MKRKTFQNKCPRTFLRAWFSILILFFCPFVLDADQDLGCRKAVDKRDGLMVTDCRGNILIKQNETQKFIPASTLKVITALTAVHYLGISYRFKTEFYTDPQQNLTVKGYGDPLLISEVWQDIAQTLSKKMGHINCLILDDTYFFRDNRIPGTGMSANPYDAPTGALCANFNTVFFEYDQEGKIISSEPQTPILPFAVERIKALGLKKSGRCTFIHKQKDPARYAGALLLHFLEKSGITHTGDIGFGKAQPDSSLIYTYESCYTLGEVIQKMMAYSNNFIANQICIALGAQEYGPPGTLEKGVLVIRGHVKNELGLHDISIMEGSGISRENRVSPQDMQVLLERFKPHRHLLKKEKNSFFKTGTLKGINTRVGYLENETLGSPYRFVVFLNHEGSDMARLMRCINAACNHP